MKKLKNKKKVRVKQKRKLKKLGHEIANSPPVDVLTTTCPNCFSMAILDRDAFFCGKCNVRFSIKIKDENGDLRRYPTSTEL